jgi:hypothetical protein
MRAGWRQEKRWFTHRASGAIPNHKGGQTWQWESKRIGDRPKAGARNLVAKPKYRVLRPLYLQK